MSQVYSLSGPHLNIVKLHLLIHSVFGAVEMDRIEAADFISACFSVLLDFIISGLNNFLITCCQQSAHLKNERLLISKGHNYQKLSVIYIWDVIKIQSSACLLGALIYPFHHFYNLIKDRDPVDQPHKAH